MESNTRGEEKLFQFIQKRLKLRLIRSDKTIHNFSVLEEEESRDTRNLKAIGEFATFINIDLQEGDLWKLIAEFRKVRGDSFARTTPHS